MVFQCTRRGARQTLSNTLGEQSCYQLRTALLLKLLNSFVETQICSLPSLKKEEYHWQWKINQNSERHNSTKIPFNRKKWLSKKEQRLKVCLGLNIYFTQMLKLNLKRTIKDINKLWHKWWKNRPKIACLCVSIIYLIKNYFQLWLADKRFADIRFAVLPTLSRVTLCSTGY